MTQRVVHRAVMRSAVTRRRETGSHTDTAHSGDDMPFHASARLLLVETNPIERLLVRSAITLRNAPIALREASDFDLALQLLRQEHYDLVLIGGLGRDWTPSAALAAVAGVAPGVRARTRSTGPADPELLLREIRDTAA